MQVDGIGPGVPAEDRGFATGRAQYSEQDADGGGLACAVGTEETVDLAGADV